MMNNLEMIAKPNATTALYSSPTDLTCHCVRFVVSEKDIPAEKYHIRVEQLPEDLSDLNPYQMLPVLYDRQMVLYDLSVITEYLDERFPCPPLMPIDPIERAEKRLLLFRFTRAHDSWFSLCKRILNPASERNAKQAKKLLTSHLIDLIPIFEYQPYFKSDTLTIIDICLATILWRLDMMGIKLPKQQAKPIFRYANRLFRRESFQQSLSDLERDYR